MQEINTYLITGAGSGLGKGVALGLASQGRRVIAAVETEDQAAELSREAAEKEIKLLIEKLDITEASDRERAFSWDVDVLINNAGINLGGALVDIPEDFLRRQFEVNVFGTILLSQGFAKQMARRRRGRIIIVSSIYGLAADPLMGAYGASKHALEAFGISLARELQEFGVEVQLINPGPYLTGFNDRAFESWKDWQDNPEERLFDYEKLAFPYPQFDPEGAIRDMISIVLEENGKFRNIVPKAMTPIARQMQKSPWKRTSDKGLHTKDATVTRSLEMEPARKPSEAIKSKIKDIFSTRD
ncbi:MAG: SDR family oxidoreductase [Eubacteriales bacterium]|nr:SDR family oxidoreductase [Eubacteriales bacterium]MDD4541879.1 SDR family oxidoreductase [Eubacteriales bacterium]